MVASTKRGSVGGEGWLPWTAKVYSEQIYFNGKDQPSGLSGLHASFTHVRPTISV